MKSNLRNFKLLLWSIIIILGVFFVYTRTSLNFTFLGALALAIFWFVHIFSRDSLSVRRVQNLLPIRNEWLGLEGAILLAVFSGMTLWTLSNYFYADKNVYTNNEHHALKVTGVEFASSNPFLLAKNSREALFDDKQFHGSVTVESVGVETKKVGDRVDTVLNVKLDLKGFTHPIYQYRYERKATKESALDSVINSKTISFTANDKVKFVANNGESVEFWIDEFVDGSLMANFGLGGKDTACYWFRNVKTGTTAKSDVCNALVKGYSFNGLLSGVTNHDLDFNGISIVRAIAKPQAMNYERLDNKTQYIIDINEWAYKYNGGNGIKEIIIGEKIYNLKNLSSLDHKVTINLFKNNGKYISKDYYIGYGDAKTDIFSFQANSTDTLRINFKQPYYGQMYGQKDSDEHSLFVTASLVEETEKEKEKGIGANLPNNTALFKIFNHSNNIHNFNPFFLSYNSGHTTERLKVLHQESGTVYTSGEIIRGIRSDKSNIEWIFEVENLKETTPFSSEKMMLVVFLVCLASIIVSCIHMFWFNPKLFHRYTFSYAEFLLHIVLIFFISYRCFLLWRTSVFIPLESISAYEWFTIFRPANGVTHFVVMLICIFGFYFTLARFKIMMLNCYRLENQKNSNNGKFVIICSNRRFLIISIAFVIAGGILFYQNERIFALLALALAYLLLEIFFYAKRKYNAAKSDRVVDEYDLGVYYLLENTFFKLCSRKWIAEGKMFLMLQIALYAAGVVISRLNSRVGLLVIVVVFFLLEAFIYARSRYKTYELDVDDEVADEEGRVYLLKHDFFTSVFNMIIAAGSMFLSGDTGFFIMFATFSLFAIGFKAQDVYIKIAGSTQNNLRSALFVVIYILGVSLLLLFYKPFMVWAVTSKYSVPVILCSCVVAVIAVFWFAEVGLLKQLMNLKARIVNYNRKRQIILAICLITVCGGVIFMIPKKFDGTIISLLGAHTQQRIKVLDNRPDDVLKQIKSNSDENRFLDASYNHWIIEQYHKRSEDVSLLGDGGTGYFRIHPQSKLGALWNAQVTDIVLIRYVITEHSKILPLCFILLLLLMLYQGVRMTTYYRFTKILLIQIPLLLFVQALLVWMANTQRFIFFGQDFPLLSITPKVMLAYVFALLLIWTLAAVLESVMYRKSNSDVYYSRKAYNVTQAWTVLTSLVIVLACFFVFGEPDSSLKGKGNDGKENKYSMVTLLGDDGKAAKYFRSLDTLFASYQKTNKLVLRRDMHPQIRKFNEACKSQIDTIFKIIALSNEVNDINDTIFPKRIWNNYVNGGSRNNSFSGIIHVRNKRVSSESDMRLEIALRDDYYDTSLPYHTDNEWKGNIVEDESKRPLTGSNMIETGSYSFYKLHDSWMKEGQMPYFFKAKGGKIFRVFSVETNLPDTICSEGIDNVISLNNNDYVSLIEGKTLQRVQLPNGTHDYWARNVVVNGRRQFIYSLGESMYWVRDFANVVKSIKDDSIGDLDKREKDVSITLDRKLTQDIFAIFKKYGKLKSVVKTKNGTKDVTKDVTDSTFRSVIVADGNGHIRAMVDYKKGYIINPNNDEKINEIIEELYMNYSQNSINEERMWFQNRNLSHLALGPASSQKPLVWNAVASYANMEWDKVVLSGFQHTKLKELEKYNGETIKEFEYKNSDELGGDPITLEKFLANSSNFYSALMVYMGLHNLEHFNDGEFLKLKRPEKSSGEYAFKRTSLNPEFLTIEDYHNNYPFLKIGDKAVQLDHKIDKNDYNRSLLHHQFTTIYGLNDSLISFSDTVRIKGHFYDTLLTKENIRRIANVIPEASSLNFDMFVKDEEKVNSGMRNIALGAYKYWSVTPFHMAEMFGRMVSMNSNYCLSLDPLNSNNTISWNIKNDNYNRQRGAMFKGMSNFFTEGTGKRIIQEGGKNVVKKTIGKKVYYFYGKTGTASGKIIDLNHDGKEDAEGTPIGDPRRLAIIISDTKLHYEEKDNKRIEPSAYKPNKFYILYFTYDVDNFKFKETSKDIIEEVLKSDVFNNYMNDNGGEDK